MSHYYWYGKMPKGPPGFALKRYSQAQPKTLIYKTGETCIVLTMQERVELATLFSILLKVERRIKDGTKQDAKHQPKIKGSLNREPFDLFQMTNHWILQWKLPLPKF